MLDLLFFRLQDLEVDNSTSFYFCVIIVLGDNMNGVTNPLFGVLVIDNNGNTKYNSCDSYKKTHNKLLYEIKQAEIDRIDEYDKALLVNNRVIGLWPYAGLLSKFYNDVVVLENFEYRVSVVFIPENVSEEQINVFRRTYSKDGFKTFGYGDRTLEDGVFKIKSIKNEPLDYIIDIMNSKQNIRRR